MMQEKTKILYIITKSNWGGAQKYVYDFATSLSKEDYDITVVLGEPREDTVESGKGKLFEALESKNIRRIPIKEFQRDINIFEELIVLIKLFNIFRKEKPNVIHVNSSKAGGLGVVAGWLAGIKKRIFTVHGWPFNESRSWLAKQIIYFFSKLTLAFSTKVVCMSEENYEQALQMTNNHEKIVLIYNGISDIEFKSKLEARQILIEHIRSSSSKVPNENMKWVGTISELTKNKGVRYLIGAISRYIKENPLEPINGVIIGDGEEREELERIIESENLSEYVFLAGFIPDASTLLNAFDIVTLTSIKEGNPFILLESGMAQKPVIASNIKGVEDLLKDGCGILADKGDVIEISNQISKLISDKSLSESIATKLHEKVTKNFTFEQTLEKTTALY